MQVEGVLCHRRLNYHQKYIRHISYQKKIHFSTTGKMNTRYFIQTVNLLGEEVASMFSSSTNAQYSPYSRVSFPFLFECSAALRLKNIIYLLAKILHFSVHQQKYIYIYAEEFLHPSVTQPYWSTVKEYFQYIHKIQMSECLLSQWYQGCTERLFNHLHTM